MFSILHISDLHRSKREPISNSELVSALIADRERYVHEDPPIRPPDAITVSGDVIQGVRLGESDYEAKLEDQYRVAEEFLIELSERFLAGDRSRIVIVPGNHDICWNTAKAAMSSVPDEEAPEDLRDILFSEGTEYRWDWKERKLYLIRDHEQYARRLDSYWNFVEHFYRPLEPSLRPRRGARAHIWSLDSGRIGVAAFDSCDGNDCYASHGSIPREVIARTHLDMIAPGRAFELRMAVWHHSIEGPPYRTDYMDVDLVRGMIGRGYRLGLYGHQHRAQAAPHQVYLPASETMGVVSAGSLCAGANELPTGVHRQYSVVEIADDYRSARVHVRAMLAANLFGRGTLNDQGGKSFAVLQWQPPMDISGRTLNVAVMRTETLLRDAEVALKGGRASESVGLLLPHLATLPAHGRRLFFEAAGSANDWAALVTASATPQTIGELVARVDAQLQLGDSAGALASIEQHGAALELDPATARDLRERVSLRKGTT